MMTKLRFGILGAGYIGKRHAEHICNHPEAELAGVYDIKPERAKALAELFNTQPFYTLESFLEVPMDVVNICTPNGLHAQGAIAALKSQKHVVVEKPMALNSEDCEQMIHEAMNRHLNLFVVKQNRYNPPIVALKKLMEEGKLGKIYMVNLNCYWNRNARYYTDSDWKGSKDLDGGTLFTQFSHFIDIIHYLFGYIKHPQGSITNANHGDLIQFEDTGTFTFQLPGNVLGSMNYTTCATHKNMEGSITVFAEKATIKVGGQYLNTLEYQELDGLEPLVIETIEKANDYGFYKGSMSNHDVMIQNVVDFMKGQSAQTTNALDGMKTVQAIEEMYKNAVWIPS